MTEGAIYILITVAVVGVLLLFLILAMHRQQKTNSETQRDLSDRDLLRLLDDQPDQLLSPHQLRDLTGLPLTVARSRLSSLFVYGVLHRSSNARARHFYGLKDPLWEAPALELSSDPFLTVEDLLQIFATHAYRVTPQELIVATGLPLAIIKREMKFFEKQGIVQKLQRTDSNGAVSRRFFVLQEPYRSDPEQFRQKAGVLNLEMRKILRNDNLLV